MKRASEANKRSILQENSSFTFKTLTNQHPFLSKKFVLVNAMKIQTYGNQFLLAFRVALPALADNIL